MTETDLVAAPLERETGIDAGDTLRRLDESAVDRLLKGMLVLGVFGVPLSVSRAILTGWQPTYSLHLGGLAFLLALVALRSRVSAVATAWSILALTLAVTIFGMTTYGLLGNGMIWALFSLFLAMAFIGVRAVAVAAPVIGVATAVSCYLFVFSGRRFPGDAANYLAALPSWGTAVFGGAVFGVLIVSVISIRRRELERALVLLEQKSQQLAHAADHDDLTGLPVFRVFLIAAQSCLEQARREPRHIAVLFIDLDGFKQVNDAFGHGVGDRVLKDVASDISRMVRSGDLVTRMGGDEFLVLINSSRAVDLELLGRRLVQAVSREREYERQSIRVGASIGVAKLVDENETVEELIQRADQLMYGVKRGGRNAFSIS